MWNLKKKKWVQEHVSATFLAWWSGPCYSGPKPKRAVMENHAGSVCKKAQEVLKGLHFYYCRSAGGEKLDGHFSTPFMSSVSACQHCNPFPSLIKSLWKNSIRWAPHSIPLREINMTDVAPFAQIILVKMNGRITTRGKEEHNGQKKKTKIKRNA